METSNYIDEKQLKELEERLKEGKAKLEKFVQEYPLASVAIAFGVGYIISRLLNNRGKR